MFLHFVFISSICDSNIVIFSSMVLLEVLDFILVSFARWHASSPQRLMAWISKYWQISKY